jgi:hypothetical protein
MRRADRHLTSGIGNVTFVAQGQDFKHRITVDASSIPIPVDDPQSGTAILIVEDRSGKHSGTFSLVTWRPSGNLQEPPKFSFPEPIQVKIAPFEHELISLGVQPYMPDAPPSTNLAQKPPASFWRKSGCSMACWGTAAVLGAAGCSLTRGLMCAAIAGSTNAAAAYCDKHCPSA